MLNDWAIPNNILLFAFEETKEFKEKAIVERRNFSFGKMTMV
jgi:hypothetical protein